MDRKCSYWMNYRIEYLLWIHSTDLYIIFHLSRSISPEFNDMMRHLIDAELNTLVSNCNQNTPTKPTFLPQIIALYLMQFHGLQR